MKEIQLTQGKTALVDDDIYDYLNQWKWQYNISRKGYGYAARTLRGNGKQKLLLMHRLIMNTPDGMETDHINRCTLDNQRCNLRICTTSQNQANRLAPRSNTSGRKGVRWNKYHNKWVANIKFHGKDIFLGYHDNLDNASIAYRDKAIELFKEFVV